MFLLKYFVFRHYYLLNVSHCVECWECSRDNTNGLIWNLFLYMSARKGVLCQGLVSPPQAGGFWSSVYIQLTLE